MSQTTETHTETRAPNASAQHAATSPPSQEETGKRLLSVVIPAYNVESYISECLASVFKQPDLDKYVDVIVIVDGATDTTLEMVDSTLDHFGTRAEVRFQENGGLSAARNAGLLLATTDYVTFLDGDDVWLDNYLESVLPYLLNSNNDVDILEYDAIRMTEDGRQLYRWKVAAAPEGEVQQITRDKFIDVFRCYSWARVFRTALVRTHPFPSGRRYEDSATTPWYYWDSRQSLSVGTPLIGYRVRAESILASPRAQDIDDIAATTREAADMYARTKTTYWQRVAHYSFQQACGRIVYQPLRTWSASIRLSRDAVAGVPPPAGHMRWLQMHATFLYTYLLYLKNSSERAFIRFAPPKLVRLLFPRR
ncbi:glycosyltransferase family A protein [Rhodanobacter sp. DHG33]|uniref:glycosyltransferase family 2 protein n=1 Tax=Rhodanobacter sp. DHG33 TaxID=2775921 RepID=UPI001786EA8A|nr:glycosyltransferase family A protein [Rhodanobacter sp. DHG33]MBD8899290.1 glycosyltransferase family 2 protein [Rhodanobacter sp. DHG33]